MRKQKPLRCICCGAMANKKPPFETKHQKDCPVDEVENFLVGGTGYFTVKDAIRANPPHFAIQD